MRRLPSLKAIRAFEAAGRHLSFTRAAEELNVTPGAVSRQILLLEGELGTSLFRRAHRQVKLTAAGVHFLSAVSQSFAMMVDAASQIDQQNAEQPLHIACPPTLAMRWLMPRLPDFHRAFPQHDIMLTTTMGNTDIAQAKADVVVQLGDGRWPRTISHRLLVMDLVPVCSPSFMVENGAINAIEDLRYGTWLYSLARPGDWDLWLNSVGGEIPRASHKMSFENSVLMYQAARDGLGIAIVYEQLVRDELQNGRLIAPVGHRCLSEKAFYLTYPAQTPHHRALHDFRDWILKSSLLSESR
ncbi:LysR substrate-binding domain-containing protein [Devosia sp. A449]